MSTSNDPLRVLQDFIDKNNNQDLATTQDPFVKPLTAQFAGLPNSISQDVKNNSMWDRQNADIELAKEQQGLKTLKALGNLNFNVVDDTGSRYDRGYSAMANTMQTQSKRGWGERNIEQEQVRLNASEGKAEGFILPSNEAFTYSEKAKGVGNWFYGVAEGIEKFFHETDIAGDYKRLETKMAEKDSSWTEEKKQETFEIWKKKNQDAYAYMLRSGINFNDYVAPTLNETAFNVGIMEAARQSAINYRMGVWEKDTGAVFKFAAGAWEGFKDPLMARDMVAATILTAGLGTIQAVGSELVVAGVEGTGSTLKVSQLARAAASIQKLAGPMTGLIEGPLYAGLKATVFTGAGRAASQTATARAIAMFTEGAVAGFTVAIADQEDQYDWRSLVFKDTDKLVKYDYDSAITQGITSGLAAAGMLGVMRFGLGALGDFKYYRKGDWVNWRKGIANSLDGWATTKEGLIVYGEELSDGRGIAFGNSIDKYMAGKDGRNFTNIMLNGDRLFGRLDSTIAAKMNLDTVEALKVADALEKATGIAGEAAMRRVAGVDPHMSTMFMQLLDKKFLDEHNLSYDDAVKTINSYREFSNNSGMFPLQANSEGRLLTDLTGAVKNASQELRVRHISRLLDTKILDRRVEQIGLTGSDILSEAEGLVGRRLDIMDNADFSTYKTTAGYLAGNTDEANVSKLLQSVMSSTDPEVNIGGRVIPTETAKQIFRSALGLGTKEEEGKKKLHYLTDATDTNDPTFAIMFDPATNEVVRSKRRLVATPESELKRDGSRVRVELDVKNNASYTPDNITTMSKFTENMESAKQKIHEVWVSSLKEKVKKEISKIKDATKRKQVEFIFDDVFNKAKDPSIESIASVFGMNKKEATVSSIIMKTLGFSPEDHLMRIVKSAAGTIDEKATANIVLSGTRALIQSTKESDLGSIAHEMGHYHRFTFIGRSEEAVKARHAAGITDSEWKKFTDWVGNEEEIWSTDPEFAILEKQAKEGETPELKAEAQNKINKIIKAEEKFANGWATFVKNLMSGKGKAPSTAIQRLFHRLGDHLGNLGEQFKSQEALEAGLEMTPESLAVYEKFMNRNNDKISEFFDVSYRRIFAQLPVEQRNAIGAEILGEAQFNDYKAKLQKSRAEARLKNDPVIAGSAAKRISVTKLIEDIKSAVIGSPTKKLIRLALTAGLTKDAVVSSLKAIAAEGELAAKNPTKLNLSLLGIALSSDMKKISDDILLNLASEEHLGVYEVTLSYKPDFNTTTNKLELKKITRSVTRDMAIAEINRRVKTSEPRVEAISSEEIMSTLDELETPTGFVDGAGLPVHLTGTEATTATLRAIEREETRATAETAADVARTLEEATDITSVAAVADLLLPKEESSADKVLSSDAINLEEDPTRTPQELGINTTIRRLRAIQKTAKEIGSELSIASKTQLDDLVVFVRNNTEGIPALLEAWKKFQETNDPTAPRPPLTYLIAELKNVIARETLDGLVGLDDATLEAFAIVREDILRLSDMKEVEVALRESTPENISAMSIATGIPEDKINLFLLGDKHIRNQLEIAEFNKASSFVKDNAVNYESGIKYLEDNKSFYETAKEKKNKTPEDKQLIKNYNGRKAFVTRFENSRNRVSIGRLGESVVDHGSLELAKANSLFEVSNIKTYSKLSDIFYAKDRENIDITDLLGEFERSPQTMRDIAIRLGARDTDNPKDIFLAWASGEDSYGELDLSNDAVAKKYVRGVIKNLDANEGSKGTKKKIRGLVQMNRDGDEVSIGEQMTSSGRDTKSMSNFAANNESALLTFTAGILHEQLIKNGKTQLAEYFAARRATYWLPGNREDNLRSAFNLRANMLGLDMLTEKNVVSWEIELRSELKNFANELRLRGYGEAANVIMSGELNLKETNTTTVLNQGSLGEAFDHLDSIVSGYMESGRTEPIKPELLSKMNSVLTTESVEFRKVMSDVIYGNIKNGSELLDALSTYKHGYSNLVNELKKIDGVQEMLKDVLVMVSNDKHGTAAFHFRTSTIGLCANTVLSEDTVLHEIFHALTSNRINTYEESNGLSFLNGEDYIARIKDLLSSDNEMPSSLRKLYIAYVRYLDSGLLPVELRQYINDFMTYNTELNNSFGVERNKYYGALDVSEFVSEGMTQPSFIKDALLISDNQITDKNAFKDLFSGVIEAAGLKVSPQALQIASNKLLKSIQVATIETIMDPENRLISASTVRSLTDLIPDSSNSEDGTIFFRLGQNNTINPLSSFVNSGKDPRTTPVIFNQSLFVPPEVTTQLKLRDDLKASKGRVYKKMQVLNQTTVHIGELDESKFKIIGGQLGSNKAKQLSGENNFQYYAKEAKSLSHAENEVLAQLMYISLGHESVKANISKEPAFGLKGPILLSNWLKNVEKYDMKNIDHVMKGHDVFIASAWLANWDIGGGPGFMFDNMDGQGRILDTGGSLKYRAQGSPKGDKFGSVVGELKSFRDDKINPSTARMFEGLSDVKMVEQAINLRETMSDGVIDNVINSVISDPKEALELSSILKQRRDYIVANVLKGEHKVVNSISTTTSEVSSVINSALENDFSQMGISKQYGIGVTASHIYLAISNLFTDKEYLGVKTLGKTDNELSVDIANKFKGTPTEQVKIVIDTLFEKGSLTYLHNVGMKTTAWKIARSIVLLSEAYNVNTDELIKYYVNLSIKENLPIGFTTWTGPLSTAVTKLIEQSPTIGFKLQSESVRAVLKTELEAGFPNHNLYTKTNYTYNSPVSKETMQNIINVSTDDTIGYPKSVENAKQIFIGNVLYYLANNKLLGNPDNVTKILLDTFKDLNTIVKTWITNNPTKALGNPILESLIQPLYKQVGLKVLEKIEEASVPKTTEKPESVKLSAEIEEGLLNGTSLNIFKPGSDLLLAAILNPTVQKIYGYIQTGDSPKGLEDRSLQALASIVTFLKKENLSIPLEDIENIVAYSDTLYVKWLKDATYSMYAVDNKMKDAWWAKEYKVIGEKLNKIIKNEDINPSSQTPVTKITKFNPNTVDPKSAFKEFNYNFPQAGQVRIIEGLDPYDSSLAKFMYSAFDSNVEMSNIKTSIKTVKYQSVEEQFTKVWSSLLMLYNGEKQTTPSLSTFKKIESNHTLESLRTLYLNYPHDLTYGYDGLNSAEGALATFLVNTFPDQQLSVFIKYIRENNTLEPEDILTKFFKDVIVKNTVESPSALADAIFEKAHSKSKSGMASGEFAAEHTEKSIYALREAIKDTKVDTFDKAKQYIRTWLSHRSMSSPYLRVEAFKVVAAIYRDLSSTKLSNEERVVKFKEFFTDAEGNDIMWKNDYGIPVLFHRGQRGTVPVDLVSTTDKGIRFWGENINVARDYHSSTPIISAYLAAPKKNVLVVKNSHTQSWASIPAESIIQGLMDFGYSREQASDTIREDALYVPSALSIDSLARILQTPSENKFDSTVWAICVENLVDMATEGGKTLPHNQWTIRADMNIMKSPEAIEFDKAPSHMRILNQKRAETAIREGIASAKAAGTSTTKLEADLSTLIDSASVRRRDLLEMKLNEETEPEDLDVMTSMIKGVSAFQRSNMSHINGRMGIGSKNIPTNITTKFKGKSYRDLSEDDRRSFVLDVLMPTIAKSVGDRNSTAGVFSTFSNSVVGKGVNSRIGGAARYGDTADSSSMGLQFLSKILDPTMDLRNGEIEGTYNLFSMDMLIAESTNMYSRSGLLAIKNKINAAVKNAGEIEEINNMAWKYSADLDKLPEGIPNRELITELIQGIQKYNTVMGETLNKYGNLLQPMDPLKYGTIHKINNLAVRDQEGFVKALTNHVLKKTRENNEISVVTADALGWLKITREQGSTDNIVSIEIPEDSPLAVLGSGIMEWNGKTKELFGKDSITKLSLEDQSKHSDGLESSKDYIDSYKRLYAGRGPDYTAVKQSMTIAKDRYIGIEDGDSKTGKPRSESVGSGKNYSEERILSHSDIAMNPDLSRYFQNNVYELINQHIHSQLTDTLMTKYITDHFGTKMSWLDLVSVLSKYGEESQNKANLSTAEQQSRVRGYDRMKNIWESHIGKMSRSKDGLDRFYEDLLTNSRTPVLVASGIRAALTSTGEVGRAILTSNHHKGALMQVIPNLIKTLQLFSKDKRRTIQEVSSATHWLRNMSSDHLLARSEVLPENPFAGAMLGTRQGGWCKRWAEEWRAVGDINKSDTSIVNRSMNRLGIVASRFGAPLAWVNDITTTLHVWNAQENFTKNSSTFLQLAEKLQTASPDNLADFNQLAKKCGLAAREALNLSTSGLLNPELVKLMIEAAKDQRNYTDGLLDVQKLYIWAGEDKTKIDTINRMGAYINSTARQTNTDPTLLDLRINQSAFAKSMGVFMQFLLSHSVQEIGRRRRYSTASYGKHLAGLFMMEAVTYSLARRKEDKDKDKWIWEEATEKPIDLTIRLASGMPMLGSYQFIGSLMRQVIQNTYKTLSDQKTDKFRLPDLYSAPAENLPNKALETFRDLF